MRQYVVHLRQFAFVLACAAAAACEEGEAAPRADAQAETNDGGVELDAASADATARDAQSSSGDGALDASLDADVSHDGGRDGRDDASAADAGATRDAEPSTACSVSAPTSCPTPAPTYGDVMPIFEARCTICHGKMEGGPWPLDKYEDIAHWTDDVRATLVSCAMPPPDAGVPITNDERRLVLEWLRCGLPR